MGQSTFTTAGTAPFVFDDNWDNFGNLRPRSRQLSAANADGAPVVPLTAEQKFAFDTQGWLCIPGVLDAMPKKRQSLFRHAYGEAANTGLETRNLFQRALG